MTADTLEPSMPVSIYGGPSLSIFIPGPPQTAGSKTSVPIMRKGEGGKREPVMKGDRVVTRVIESGSDESRARKQSWRTDLRDAAERAIEEQRWPRASEDAIEALFVFIRPRPSAHLTTGRAAGMVKDWARDLRPTTRPDALKFARAAEDALSGIAWADDSQIVDERLHKIYGDQFGESPRFEGTLIVARMAPTYSGPLSTTAGPRAMPLDAAV